MKSLTRRLVQLEQYRPVSCRVCAGGTAETIRIAFAGEPDLEIPETCPGCGRRVPSVVPQRAFLLFLIWGVGLESWHVVEHLVILTHVVQNRGCPCPGIADSVTGLTDTVIHFGYNTIAFVATVIPFLYLLPRSDDRLQTADPS